MDALTANPNVIVWAYDDFAGGAEQKYYNLDIPDTWWYGKCNPRIRGALNSVPTQAQNSSNTTSAQATEAYFVNVGGNSWLFADRQAFYSTDGATWNAHSGNPIWGANNKVVGAAHDGFKPWVAVHDGTNLVFTRIDSTSATTTAVTSRAAPRVYGMAQLEGKMYAWTGGALYEYNSQATLPIAHQATTSNAIQANKVHQPVAETPSGTIFAGIVASEASIFYFTSSAGGTAVYEYKYNGAVNQYIGRPVWNPPGLTCRFITFSNGVLYLLGEYNDQVALFGMSVITREPLFLTYVGQQYGAGGTTLTPRGLAPSYGAQILLSVDDGTTTYYFIYDAELDALSELDERTISADGTALAQVTFKNRRLSAAAGSTTMRVNRWNQDYDATSSTGGTWVSSAWNMAYPYDEKLLFGFQVVQDPSQASGTVQVEYQKDEDGSWVSAGTTSAGVKYTYFDISANNVKFRNIRLRLTLASGARVFSVTTRAYINTFQELWKLTLKLKGENADRDGRPSFRQAPADVLANYLWTLVQNRNVVTFLDGRRYQVKGGNNVGYTTHTVVLEFPRDSGISITRNKDRLPGAAQVILRSTAP